MVKRKSDYGGGRSKRRRITGRRKRMYRGTRGRGKLVPIIKKTILRMAEPKHKITAWDKQELWHNCGSLAGTKSLGTVWAIKDYGAMPTQGDSDVQRNGDHIYMQGIKVKVLLGQKEDRMNVTFRIVVIECTTDQEPYAVTGSGGLYDGVANHNLLDSVNTDRGRILYQKFIKKTISPQLGSAGAERELTHTHAFYIPHKRRIKFTDDVSNNQYSGSRIYMYVHAYDAFGTLLTDNIGYAQGWSKLYYRDP